MHFRPRRSTAERVADRVIHLAHEARDLSADSIHTHERYCAMRRKRLKDNYDRWVDKLSMLRKRRFTPRVTNRVSIRQ